jgi:hypothetical protein
MINYAPLAATEYMRRWLFHESRTFVGNKDEDGVFRKKLLRKKNKRGGTWSKFVAGRFKGYVENKNTLNMALHMGPNLSKHGRIRAAASKGPTSLGMGKILEGMENPYSITPSTKKWLIIPNYENLKNFGVSRIMRSTFRNMYDGDKLEMIKNKSGTRLMFFLKDQNNGIGNAFNSQLFFGVRRTRIKKQFSFISSWNARVPTVLKRGERYLKSAMSRTQKQDAAQWQIPG